MHLYLWPSASGDYRPYSLTTILLYIVSRPGVPDTRVNSRERSKPSCSGRSHGSRAAGTTT